MPVETYMKQLIEDKTEAFHALIGAVNALRFSKPMVQDDAGLKLHVAAIRECEEIINKWRIV
jgi:hypothetical protein